MRSKELTEEEFIEWMTKELEDVYVCEELARYGKEARAEGVSLFEQLWKMRRAYQYALDAYATLSLMDWDSEQTAEYMQAEVHEKERQTKRNENIITAGKHLVDSVKKAQE